MTGQNFLKRSLNSTSTQNGLRYQPVGLTGNNYIIHLFPAFNDCHLADNIV